jgi:AraC-like DNA-binding protein
MANTKNDPSRNAEPSNLTANYSDGDVVIYNHVKDVTNSIPIRTKYNNIVVCISGTSKAVSGDNEIKIKANDILFCPSNTPVDHIEASSDYECRVLCLADDILHDMLHDQIDTWHRAIYVNQLHVISMSETFHQEFELYYALINSKIQNHREVSKDILQTLIRALLLEISKILKHRPELKDDSKLSQGKRLFNRFLKLVSTNDVKRRPITYYADQLAITPKYLTMLCLKYSNKTASDWIIQYASEDIRFYLRNSNLSIKEVSAKLGFANMSHFGSYTRKHLGASPSDIRHNKP